MGKDDRKKILTALLPDAIGMILDAFAGKPGSAVSLGSHRIPVTKLEEYYRTREKILDDMEKKLGALAEEMWKENPNAKRAYVRTIYMGAQEDHVPLARLLDALDQVEKADPAADDDKT